MNSVIERDKHVRRSGDDYAVALMTLLPQGQAWVKSVGTALEKCCTGLSQIWGYVDGRAADLLERESDPRLTIELLPDWERNWGLPDPCLTEPLTIADRQRVLVQRITMLGGQSHAWFHEIAGWLGYEITIREFSPFMCGISRVGDTRYLYDDVHYRWELGPPEMRFYWTVTVDALSLTWFRLGGGGGECGVDPHVRIGFADYIECLFDRWKPAHTEIVFDYGPGLPGRWDLRRKGNAWLWPYYA